jgi:hypothetical protein
MEQDETRHQRPARRRIDGASRNPGGHPLQAGTARTSGRWRSRHSRTLFTFLKNAPIDVGPEPTKPSTKFCD